MIAGLPIHPLVVHFVVALLTLLPLAVLVSLLWPRLRRMLDWLLPLGAVVAAVLAFVAGQTGEVLEHSLPVRLPAVATHAGWGEWVMRVSGVFALAVVAWWASVTEAPPSFLDRPALRGEGVRRGLAVVAGLASVAILVLVTLAGHSGATAVWGH